jgi:hypothetical protein
MHIADGEAVFETAFATDAIITSLIVTYAGARDRSIRAIANQLNKSGKVSAVAYRVATNYWQTTLASKIFSWLRVSDTTDMPQIDQGVRHQFHTVVPLLFELKAQRQPLEFILPRKSPFYA